MPRRTVAIGLLGTTLDAGTAVDRWNRWRPTIALCRQEDLVIDRLELLHSERHSALVETVRADIRSVSPETEVRTHAHAQANPWDFEEVFGTLHDFARGYRFDPQNEDYYVHITTGTHVAQICMFLLTESRHFPARLVQTSPPRARDPTEPGRCQVIDLDLSRYDRIASRFADERKEGLSFLKSGIETRDRRFNRLIEEIERVAIASREPILLTGPTGSGKSHLARRIYELKKSRHQLEGGFVEVNCATLRGDAAMSALFGHRKGAFTGALSDRPGLLRAADGGLLFLDEIGELGSDEQAMLLRAVEEKRFLPLGSDREAESRFQLIAGTNRDLKEDVARGRFREDLLARINLWTFSLPRLRDRLDDLEPNIDYELEKQARTTGRRTRFNKEARSIFLDFAGSPEGEWPANFRDLNAAVTRMAALAPGGRITLEVVRAELERLRSQWRTSGRTAASSVIEDALGPEAAARLDRFDRAQLADVLLVCRGCVSLSQAGRALFEVSRRKKKQANDADRLRKYLARFGLKWEDGRVVRGESA